MLLLLRELLPLGGPVLFCLACRYVILRASCVVFHFVFRASAESLLLRDPVPFTGLVILRACFVLSRVPAHLLQQTAARAESAGMYCFRVW
jgi:hypothetical protein